MVGIPCNILESRFLCVFYIQLRALLGKCVIVQNIAEANLFYLHYVETWMLFVFSIALSKSPGVLQTYSSSGKIPISLVAAPPILR